MDFRGKATTSSDSLQPASCLLIGTARSMSHSAPNPEVPQGYEVTTENGNTPLLKNQLRSLGSAQVWEDGSSRDAVAPRAATVAPRAAAWAPGSWLLAKFPGFHVPYRTWSRSSTRASWSCHIHAGTRTGPPSCIVLSASVCTQLSSHH